MLQLGGCNQVTPQPPAPTETPSPSATVTQLPTQTLTRTATPSPSSTSTRTPTSTPSPRRTPTLTPTRTITPGPSPTLSAAELCARTVAAKPGSIFVVYIHPTPDLVWDQNPRQFLVGLCNTIPLSSTPQGKYKIILNFPGSNHGLTESAPVQAELKPGLNEVSVGPWVPGLENHLASCATRAVAQTQVMYNDTPDPFYHPLLWVDGSDRVPLPIACGGNYP